MSQRKPPCVFASDTEQVLETIPGPTPECAMRVRVEPGRQGYARIEQLAYSADLGWYCQKSFVVPGEMIKALVTQLRKADCLVEAQPAPQAGESTGATLRFVPAPNDELPSTPQRREA